ncbi:MAG: TMEM43 family protein, partial [Lysobacteraceae bacterium]
MTLRRASFAACALFALLFATMPVVLTAAPTSAVDPVVEAVPPRGELWPLTPLADDSFGVSVRALALRREVRMFQWRAETDVDGSVRWSQAWAPERIAIPAALRDDGHINPERMPFQGATWRASTVELDGRTVDPSLYAHFDDWEPFSIDAASLPPNLAASFSSVDGCVHSGEDAANPVVGDLRIC